MCFARHDFPCPGGAQMATREPLGTEHGWSCGGSLLNPCLSSLSIGCMYGSAASVFFLDAFLGIVEFISPMRNFLVRAEFIRAHQPCNYCTIVVQSCTALPGDGGSREPRSPPATNTGIRLGRPLAHHDGIHRATGPDPLPLRRGWLVSGDVLCPASNCSIARRS